MICSESQNSSGKLVQRQEQTIIGLLITKSEQLESFPRSGQDKQLRADGTEIRTLRIGKYHRLKYAVTLADEVSVLQVFDLRSDHEHQSR